MGRLDKNIDCCLDIGGTGTFLLPGCVSGFYEEEHRCNFGCAAADFTRVGKMKKQEGRNEGAIIMFCV